MKQAKQFETPLHLLFGFLRNIFEHNDSTCCFVCEATATNWIDPIVLFVLDCIKQSLHPLLRTSQVSLSSNPETDFRYSAIYGTIGVYKGRIFAIKMVNKKSIDMTRSMKKELKWVRNKQLSLELILQIDWCDTKTDVYSLSCQRNLVVSLPDYRWETWDTTIWAPSSVHVLIRLIYASWLNTAHGAVSR